MVIISGQSLICFEDYLDKKVKLKIVHFCPIDGKDTDDKCKRTVITNDCSSANSSTDRYVVVIFYGPLAKTPFKKSCLKEGQLFTLQRFKTSVMPKNKVFKCNGHILKDFFEPLILVKPEYEPIIKMLVSLRDETYISSHEFDESSNDNQPLITDEEKLNRRSEERAVSEQDVINETRKPVRSPTNKRIRLQSGDEVESEESEEEFDTDSRRRVLVASKNVQLADNNSQTSDTIVDQIIKPSSQNEKSPSKSSQNEKSPTKSSQKTQSPQKQRKLEYKTLMQVHQMMPVSTKTYCHVYAILIYRDYKQNLYCLRDEKVYKFSVSLRPGNYTKEYPASKPGDIIRIHRLLLAPNALETICTDPKDVVIFQGFKDTSLFSPIHSSLNPSFDDYDKQRKQQLEEWFSDELLSNECLSKKIANSDNGFFTDLAVQVIRITQQRDRSYLEVWDTTQPALKTTKSKVSSNDMNFSQSEEELVRIINETNLSIVVTVFEQHSIDATNLKPFDIIVLFNVKIIPDRYNNGFYNYALNSGYYYGKCLRSADPESCLAKKLSTRIEEYKLMSAVNVTQHLNALHLPDPSLPIDPDDLQESEDNEISMKEDTVMKDSFELQINRININELVPVKESYLPTEHIVTIPENDVLFDDVINNGIDGQIYRVKARIIAYLPSLELEDIVTVYCTKLGCETWITLRQVLSEESVTLDTLRSTKEEKVVINCSKCKESNSCILMLRILLILEDNRRKKMHVRLQDHNAQLFFRGRTAESLLKNDADYQYVKKVLTDLCPTIQALGPNKSYNPLNYWVIQALKWEDTNSFIYNVRTAIAIRSVDKCVGHNFA